MDQYFINFGLAYGYMYNIFGGCLFSIQSGAGLIWLDYNWLAKA